MSHNSSHWTKFLHPFVVLLERDCLGRWPRWLDCKLHIFDSYGARRWDLIRICSLAPINVVPVCLLFYSHHEPSKRLHCSLFANQTYITSAVTLLPHRCYIFGMYLHLVRLRMSRKGTLLHTSYLEYYLLSSQCELLVWVALLGFFFLICGGEPCRAPMVNLKQQAGRLYPDWILSAHLIRSVTRSSFFCLLHARLILILLPWSSQSHQRRWYLAGDNGRARTKL